MKLFDEIIRSYSGPALYAEPKFEYYNRSARSDIDRIRRLLEEWFSHYPVNHQQELRSRFRSSINSHHYSSLFELFIHELLLCSGYRVTIHPDVKGMEKKPDFLAESSECPPFYIEATLATDKSVAEIAENARMNEVYDALNRMDSPKFFIEMEISGAPKTPPSAKIIRSFLTEKLKLLDPDDVGRLWKTRGRDSVPRWHFEHNGWIIDFYPVPKSPKSRDLPGTRPVGIIADAEVQVMDSHSAIRNTVIAKANRYGRLDLPYVIAVNALGEHVENIDIMNALFGEEQIVVNFGCGPQMHKETRAHNGVWIGPSGIQYKGISAVLITHPFYPYSIPKTPIRLYHNPWARIRCTSHLTRLPQAVPETTPDGNIKMPHKDGDSLAEIFNLSAEWLNE